MIYFFLYYFEIDIKKYSEMNIIIFFCMHERVVEFLPIFLSFCRLPSTSTEGKNQMLALSICSSLQQLDREKYLFIYYSFYFLSSFKNNHLLSKSRSICLFISIHIICMQGYEEELACPTGKIRWLTRYKFIIGKIRVNLKSKMKEPTWISILHHVQVLVRLRPIMFNPFS